MSKTESLEKLLQKFWEFNTQNNIGYTGVALYLFLLNVWHECGDKSFKLSDVFICDNLGLTRPTIKTTRDKLQNLGLINFQNRNGIPCFYTINTDFSFSKVEQKGTEKFKKSPKAQLKPKKKVAGLISDALIPNETEFLDYARSFKDYVPVHDTLIIEKYKEWKISGWVNKIGKPISDWKMSLQNIYPFLINGTSQALDLESVPSIKTP
ncbi:TPA: hypothetical protein ACGZ9U_003511 [Elizabethkingia anophelis]